MRSPRRCLGALLALACVFAACAKEGDDVVRARTAHEIAADLMSPFCPGRTLAECGSPDAAAVREEIRNEVAAGDSPDAIRTRIDQRFGDRVIGVPRGGGGWALPIGALVAGAAVLALVIRRALAPAVEPAPLPPDLREALKREIDDIKP